MRKGAATLMLLIVAACAIGGVPGARATHPEEDPDRCRGTIGGMYLKHASEPRLQVPVVADGVMVPLVDAASGPFYLDVRDVLSEYFAFNIWLYEESNRSAGLQRGGRDPCPDSPMTCGIDPCHDRVAPDRQVF